MSEETEKYRLTFLLKETLNRLEKTVSKLKNGFLDDNDFMETKKTINRLHIETNQICNEIEDLE